jgi:hypothetical protein
VNEITDTRPHCDQCGAPFDANEERSPSCEFHRCAIDPEEDLSATQDVYGINVRCPMPDGRTGVVRAVVVNYEHGDAWLIELENAANVTDWMQTLVTYPAGECTVLDGEGLARAVNGMADRALADIVAQRSGDTYADGSPLTPEDYEYARKKSR